MNNFSSFGVNIKIKNKRVNLKVYRTFVMEEKAIRWNQASNKNCLFSQSVQIKSNEN